MDRIEGGVPTAVENHSVLTTPRNMFLNHAGGAVLPGEERLEIIRFPIRDDMYLPLLFFTASDVPEDSRDRVESLTLPIRIARVSERPQDR